MNFCLGVSLQVNLLGCFTSGGLETTVEGGRLTIKREGAVKKFVSRTPLSCNLATPAKFLTISFNFRAKMKGKGFLTGYLRCLKMLLWCSEQVRLVGSRSRLQRRRGPPAKAGALFRSFSLKRISVLLSDMSYITSFSNLTLCAIW